MKMEREVDIDEVQRHEQKTGANVRLGGYNMDKHCPISEFQCFCGFLGKGDVSRLFVLQDFAAHTREGSCRMRDVLPREAKDDEGVASFIKAQTDLRSSKDPELVIVCNECQNGPLLIIDGNHRAIAQYLTHDTMSGVPVYVCVHPKISQWPDYVPPLARQEWRLLAKGK